MTRRGKPTEFWEQEGSNEAAAMKARLWTPTGVGDGDMYSMIWRELGRTMSFPQEASNEPER